MFTSGTVNLNCCAAEPAPGVVIIPVQKLAPSLKEAMAAPYMERRRFWDRQALYKSTTASELLSLATMHSSAEEVLSTSELQPPEQYCSQEQQMPPEL